MRKSVLYSALALVMGMMMSSTLIACGSDEDNDNEPDAPNASAYYQAKYVTDLEEDWFDFFDVSITYTGISGLEMTEAIELNTDLSVKINANVVPSSINFKIHVVRKPTLPDVDPEQVYHFTGKAQLLVQEYLKDNIAGSLSGNLLPSTTRGTSISGKDMEKFLERYNNTDIFDWSVEVN